MFKDLWRYKLSQVENNAQAMTHEIAKLDKQIEKLLDRIVDAETPSVIGAFEKRIQKLEQKCMELTEKSQKSTTPTHPFEEMFERAMTFLSSPCNIWKNGDLTMKRQVLRLAFSENLAYQRGKGLRTPKMSAPFQLIQRLSEGVRDNFDAKSIMAHWGCARQRI